MSLHQHLRAYLFGTLVFIVAMAALGQLTLANTNWTVVTPASPSSPAQEQTSTAQRSGLPSGTLAADTPYATPYFVKDSGVPGPTVMVVGGVHGNETAGYMAAKQLTSIMPTRGKLIIIPEANRLGIEANARIGGHPGDLNRQFPQSRSQQPGSPLAKAIWRLVQDHKPDYLFDLHEGYDFHKLNSDSVGQSIIYYPKGNTVQLAKAMQRAANSTVSRSDHTFSLLKYPIKGSLARAAAVVAGAKSMILETSRKQPLNLRVKQHTTMVKAALEHLNML